MRNWVAKNDFNRAATHRDRTKYSRTGYNVWDEDYEPPKYFFFFYREIFRRRV